MSKYPKYIAKKIRELADLARQRELDKEIAVLFEHFNNWREKKIDCFQLNELIHKFHNEQSRNIWARYSSSKADSVVADAIVRGILHKEEIPEDILQSINKLIDVYGELHK